MHVLACSRASFHRWTANPVRNRWDYFSHDHAIDDMLNDDYFRSVLSDVVPGDRICIVDRDENEAEVRVQYADEETNKVGIALVERLVFKPAAGDYQMRIAGGRGRGTRYQVVDGEGNVVEDGIAGKKTAERLVDSLKEQAA